MYRAAIARPVSTIVAALTLAALGLLSLLRLPVSLLPQLERPALLVTAIAKGKSREEMIRRVTQPFERRLAVARDVASMVSETEDEKCVIRLQTEWQSDADRVRLEVGRSLEDATDLALDELTVSLVSGDASPIIEVAVLGGGSQSARTTYAEKVLLPELARVAGAGEIEVVGRRPLRAVVAPDPARLAARGLTVLDLVNRLDDVGVPIAAGRIRDGAVVRPLVIRDSVSTPQALAGLSIPTTAGVARLGDVAAISLQEVRDDSAFRLRGAEGVLLRIFRAPGANAVSIAREVRKRTTDLGKSAGSPFSVEIVDDRSGEVIRAVAELGLSAIAGLLLGTIVLRYMLGRWAPTLALSVVIPASLLLAFAAFFLFGIPLNVISLAGLALATGMLVDNSIVVLEAIEQARERRVSNPALAGTSQVAVAVIASSITTLVVFVPLLYLRGVARAFFGEQAFAVVAALGASILFALTLTPVLSRFGTASEGVTPGGDWYRRRLAAAMASPRRYFMATLALVVAGALVFALLPRELFPSSRAREIRIEVEQSPGLAPEAALSRLENFEKRIRTAIGSASTVFLIQRPVVDSIANEGEPASELRIVTSDETAQALKQKLDSIAASESSLRASVSFRESAFVETLRFSDERLPFYLTAVNERELKDLHARVNDHLEKRFGVTAKTDETRQPRTATAIRWKETTLSRIATPREELGAQLQAALTDSDAGVLQVGGAATEIRIEALDEIALPSLPVRIQAGNQQRLVPLGSLADFHMRPRDVRSVRLEGRPALALSVPRTEKLTSQTLAAALDEVPRRYTEGLVLSGEAHELAETTSQMRLVFLVSIVLMFLTIAAFYESLLLPLLVMTTVPIACAGGAILLAVTGQSLNVMSMIGFILAGGIVVNHTVILIDRIEQLRRGGVAEDEAIRTAAEERYRPIIMTTATTLLGMLPLALIGGEGVELRRALATTVIGGLTVATFASLLLVPLLHRLMQRKQNTEAVAREAA